MSTLRDEFVSAGGVQTADELDRVCLLFAQKQGFERFRLAVEMPAESLVCSPYLQFDSWVTCETHNFPTLLLRALGECTIFDPVVLRLRKSPLPCLWSRAFYENAGALERWEIKAAHGLTEGLAVASPSASGVVVILDLARRGGEDSMAVTTQCVAAASLFVAIVAAAAHSILAKPA